MLSCGIDAGSALTKCVIMDGNLVVQGRGVVKSGANLARAARHALRKALNEAQIEEYDLTMIVSTGYGRSSIPSSNINATETACQAQGAIYRFPGTRTILDMGGQDTTAIRIDADGNVLDFVMNDKCSAGAGRFMESLADLLGMTIDELAQRSLDPEPNLMVTNVCSVFAEQEVINYLEKGQPLDEILAGVFMSIARRGASLLKRVGIEDEVTLSGGVSKLRGVVEALERVLDRPVNSGIDAEYIGALGAALIGIERVNERQASIAQ
jgi:predicted CoA-substrate-specific enzyme activase